MIRLNNIYFSYKSESKEIPIFTGLDFHLEQGEQVGIMGPNGSGKTTLLRLIMGLAKPAEGEVVIFGKTRTGDADFAEVRRRIGFVFQDADDQLFCPTVKEDIAFGPLNLGLSPQKASARANEILIQIGLPNYGSRITYNLSGGEKKLVSLGTALAMSPDLLILDEPTTGLDEKAEARLEHILIDSGLPCIIVSHDKKFLSRITPKLLNLSLRQ